MKFKALTLLACLFFGAASSIRAAETRAELKTLTINGGVEDGKARLVIEAGLQGLAPASGKVLFSTALEHSLQILRDKQLHTIDATFEILDGDPKEVVVGLSGEGQVTRVTGENLLDWSVRHETNGVRSLALRPRRGDKPLANLAVQIVAEQPLRAGAAPMQTLAIAPPHAALFHGYYKLEVAPEWQAMPTNSVGLIPIEATLLPAAMRPAPNSDGPQISAYRFQGAGYALPLIVAVADPEARRVVLRDYQLAGKLSEENAEFTLMATAQIKNPRGGRLVLLAGGAALVELPSSPDFRIRIENGQFVFQADKAGAFPIRLRFDAAVSKNAGWNSVDFRVAAGAIAPVTFEGLAADTQIQFANAARPERSGDVFKSFLPPGGEVKFSWKEAPVAAEGKLFYSAEMLSQVTISPGLMRQSALIEGKVMQGELSRVVLVVRGSGNVTSVQGANVLAWNFEAAPDSRDRRILVQFNQPQKESFSLQIQAQLELAAFPQAIHVMQLRPEGATRFAGHLRAGNEGAVRLEILQSSGLSQISPEQFPETDISKAIFGATATQRFAFRFSSADFALQLQADNVLTEVSVSQLLAYHLGERELSIDGELELEIREAPVRELLLRVPKGFALARIAMPNLADHPLREPGGETNAELRLTFSQPISGRHVAQLRLERNAALAGATWTLPRIEVSRAKSTRGHIAISSDAGFRLSPERTAGLTDIATAFFPRKIAGIQAAFRITDPVWEAALRVERLPQTIQADALHLFSIGEGIAYGSSAINYFISGAPISSFAVQLSDEYYNVEFTGKDLRSNWQKSTNGYVVTLNTPVSGPYTLLVTYERPFKSQGDTLTFTGARPVDAQTEQGHTLVVSAYQFQVQPANVSPGLLALEPAEVPAEHRLFFDAPILAAYRYTARPFNLQLALSPLAQAETLGLVVDRAALTTRISKDGEIVTDAQYFVKNRGNPALRLAIAEGSKLWSVTVNGATVVPVKDGDAHLIPLPQRGDPNTVQTLNLKVASRSASASRVTASAPILSAPVLLAQWNIEPDAQQRLIFRGGSLAPSKESADDSGFGQLRRLLRNDGATGELVAAFVLICFAAWLAPRALAAAGANRVLGTVIALGALVFSMVMFADLWQRLTRGALTAAPGLAFLAPVMQSGSALKIEVSNLSLDQSDWRRVFQAWPALLALIAWGWAFFRSGKLLRPFGIALGWTFLAWASLRLTNGAPIFLGVAVACFLIHLIAPVLRSFSARPVAVSLLLLFAASANAQPVADSVIQEIRIEEKFALATAKVRWSAKKNETLPLLFEPAVLTRIQYPTNAFKLVQMAIGPRRALQFVAQEDGAHDIELQYQTHVLQKDGESGFTIPTQPGLINRATLTIPEADVAVASTNAVSQTRHASTNATIVTLTLAPATDTWLAWKPRSRDTSREKPVFFAEIVQLHVPSAGVIEGVHQAFIRPAQGEISELIFHVPGAATITDVLGASLWRFDPDTRKLRVTLSPAQSKPFNVIIRSQAAAGSLPVEQTINLITVENAAAQIGSIGIATGNEVQIDNVTAESASALNLEDFPAPALELLRAQIPGLTLRRAFRYADTKASVVVQASAVEPDIRVETQETLSIGEDRTVLAVAATAQITRAGIFRLSFLLPEKLDVESLTGAALSHWTELKTDAGRSITLHLNGKTEGQQVFNITLAGPGARSVTNLATPRLAFREASKQRGQIAIVPEQGLRLQVAAREGVAQLDPQKAGIRQKGVLAFRLLQADWNLTLDIEQVDAWVQVTSLQHVHVTEAQLKIAANLQYQIENTGLKALRVALPADAESVRFRGDQVADFMAVTNTMANGLQTWEIKLHRRAIGKFLLQATWQGTLPAGATNAVARGAQAIDANLQRGFVTVQSEGRLQLQVAPPGDALQPAEWQSIPRALRQDIGDAAANFTFRLIDPAFQLAIGLQRHEATRLLPARVRSVALTSVISDEGVMLTQAKLELIPGDKRLLEVTLPKDARFWFAFVNQNGVWPWLQGGQILLPLEQQSRPDKPTTVEFFYSSAIGAPSKRSMDARLDGPKFDLPLENIAWRVFLNDKWRLAKSSGALQLQEETKVASSAVADVQNYLSNEMSLNRAQTKEAEEMLSFGNNLLQQGDPQQARRAFQNAYGLSGHDDAFNEDARVQLHNLKLQQAIVGLNVRNFMNNAAPAMAATNNVPDFRNRKDIAYTQQEARQMLDANSADDNAGLMKLAERLVQQQDAAAPAPTAIRAAVPEQGRLLTFRRAVQVDPDANLNLRLQATALGSAWPARFGAIAGIFVVFATIVFLSRKQQEAR